jgi:dihydrofolate synthase/folylpolyglutamate synthase
MTLDGTVFDFQNYIGLRLPLLGSYQPSNAAIVLTALRILEQEGITGTEEELRRGLLAVRWPARFELLQREPVIICDGGHNPQGIAAAVRSLQTYFPEQKARIVTAVMADKNYDEMIELLRPIVEHAYTVDLGNPRALPAATYAKYLSNHNISATPHESVERALTAAIDDCKRDGCPLLCLGSLYLYNAVLDALGK